MPFVPLTPEEKKQYPPPCPHPEHDPPGYMVITEVMKWRCPACDRETMIHPTRVWC